MVGMTGWSERWDGRKAGFYCISLVNLKTKAVTPLSVVCS